jgi:signal peptidase I
MKRWIFLITLGLAGGLLFRQVGFEGIYVATPSMEPTLPVGTHYFADKFTFFFRSPRRGEIVVFASPVEEGKDLIKRTIGLPGETIRIKDKTVYINGRSLSEPYVKYKRKTEILVGDNIAEIKIPDDSFFVLGDNRDESGDSATWKDPKSGEPIYFIPQGRIKGRLLNVLE